MKANSLNIYKYLRKGLIAGLFYLCLYPNVAFSQPIEINAVIRESNINVSALYARIENKGPDTVHLTKVESDISKTHELHTVSADKNGVLRMREVPFIELPSHQTTLLKPGGEHVMFIDLNAPLSPQTRKNVKFIFDNNYSTTVSVPVIPAASLVMKYLNKETDENNLAE